MNTYSYIAHWKSFYPRHLNLCGVIVAGDTQIGVYFPTHEEEEAEWKALLPTWLDDNRSEWPKQFLHEIADSANGITEDFGPVHEVEAVSLDQAYSLAYQKTVQEYGGTMPCYAREVEEDETILSDPFAGLLPPALMTPGSSDYKVEI